MAPAENRETIPEIRIGLISKIQRYRVKTGDSTGCRLGRTQLTGEAGEILLFARAAKGVEVYNGEGKLLLTARQEISLSYDDPGATSLIFDARFGSGSYWDKDKLRIYRGIIEAIPKAAGITVVNRVNLEEYLYGVVSCGDSRLLAAGGTGSPGNRRPYLRLSQFRKV